MRNDKLGHFYNGSGMITLLDKLKIPDYETKAPGIMCTARTAANCLNVTDRVMTHLIRSKQIPSVSLAGVTLIRSIVINNYKFNPGYSQKRLRDTTPYFDEKELCA